MLQSHFNYGRIVIPITKDHVRSQKRTVSYRIPISAVCMRSWFSVHRGTSINTINVLEEDQEKKHTSPNQEPMERLTYREGPRRNTTYALGRTFWGTGEDRKGK